VTADSHMSLITDLHRLIAASQSLIDHHQTVLARYCDSDGNVLPDRQAEYHEARAKTGIQARDPLQAVVRRLARLLSVQPAPTWTITMVGAEPYEGERPTSFAVCATDWDEAYRVLTSLPGYQQWYSDHMSRPDSSPPVRVPGSCYLGLPSMPEYIDLRPEQEEGTP